MHTLGPLQRRVRYTVLPMTVVPPVLTFPSQVFLVTTQSQRHEILHLLPVGMPLSIFGKIRQELPV